MSPQKRVVLNINGREESATFPAHRTLLEALRELGHMEVKCGCEKGDCGACAILIDGVALDSCLTLAWTADGHEITTVAGLGGGGDSMHPMQRAFAERGAAQCGYCTPGMLIAAKSLLDNNPDPTEDEVRVALSGNLCRCTGYTKIFDAVFDVVEQLRAAKESA